MFHIISANFLYICSVSRFCKLNQKLVCALFPLNHRNGNGNGILIQWI